MEQHIITRSILSVEGVELMPELHKAIKNTQPSIFRRTHFSNFLSLVLYTWEAHRHIITIEPKNKTNFPSGQRRLIIQRTNDQQQQMFSNTFFIVISRFITKRPWLFTVSFYFVQFFGIITEHLGHTLQDFSGLL